jgi:hypothetical protein
MAARESLYEHSALWRERVRPYLRDAIENAKLALDACPLSVEQVKLSAGLSHLRQSMETLDSNLAIAREMMDAER